MTHPLHDMMTGAMPDPRFGYCQPDQKRPRKDKRDKKAAAAAAAAAGQANMAPRRGEYRCGKCGFFPKKQKHNCSSEKQKRPLSSEQKTPVAPFPMPLEMGQGQMPHGAQMSHIYYG